MKQVESTFPVKKTYKPNDQVKRNQNEIFKFKPVTIGVERPQITYLGVNGNKSH